MFKSQCQAAHKKLIAGKCPWCGHFVGTSIIGVGEDQTGLDIRGLLSIQRIRDLVVDAKMIDLLSAAVRHEDAATRAMAAALLGKIGADAKEALPALRWLLLDEDQLVRDAAVEAIKSIDK